MSKPLAYLLTWTAYGTWLPGDRRGWTDRRHATFETDFEPPCPGLTQYAKERMKFPKVDFTDCQRGIVEAAVREVCLWRGWLPQAVNCRSNHVHVVIRCSDIAPRTAANQMKSYATRALRKGGDYLERSVWTRGGSGRHLYAEEAVAAAVRYVLSQ